MGKNEVMPQSSVARPRQGICATVGGTRETEAFIFYTFDVPTRQSKKRFVGAIRMTDLSRVLNTRLMMKMFQIPAQSACKSLLTFWAN